MRRCALVLAVAACSRPPLRDPAELIRLQAVAVAAADARDARTLARLIADDFVIAFEREVGGPFLTSDKARTIAHWTHPEPGVEALPTQIADPHAYLFGDTAVVTARITDRWRDLTGEHAAATWVSDVWALADGRWRWIASHETLLRE